MPDRSLVPVDPNPPVDPALPGDPAPSNPPSDPAPPDAPNLGGASGSQQQVGVGVGEGEAGARRRRALATVGAAAWGVVVAVGLVVGTLWVRPRGDMSLTAAPLGGSWSPHLDVAWLPAVALAALVVAHGPGLAARMGWRPLVATSALLTVAWAVALAAGRGWSDIGRPLTTKFEYLAAVPQITGPGEFLRTFTDRIAEYPTHVKGHPPGLPLAFWVLDRLHLQGPGWAAALVICGAGLATAGALVTVRAVAGAGAARRCAPFLALAPGAPWLATSDDALIAGVGWAGIALLVAGRRPAAHVAGGAVLGLAALLTYGAVPLLAVPVVVAVARGDLRPLARAAGGLAAVIGLAAAAGFWWVDGLAATHEQYWAGVASDRPFGLFTFVVNPAALAFATGPAVAAGLALTLTDGVAGARRAWATGGRAWRERAVLARRAPGVAAALVPLGGLLAVIGANASGLSKGEVERIWLPFVPALVAATAALGHRRAWLAAQAAVTVAVVVALDSPW